MRQVSPYLHDFIHSLRSALAVLVCGFIGFILLFPVSTAAVPERSIFNINYTHQQLKFRFFDADLSLFVTLAVVLFGVALALVLFGFLRNKRASVTFLSLGILRWRLYLHRFIAGLLYLVLGIGLPLLVSLLLNIVALDLFDGELAAFAFVLSGYLACGLVAFAVTAVACVCAGTLFECVAFALALLGCMSVVAWGLDSLTSYLLVGSPFGKMPFGSDQVIAPSLLSLSAGFNPVLFFNDLAAVHQAFEIRPPVYVPAVGDFLPVLVWLVVAVAVALAGCWLLRRRPGEQAQMAGANTPLAFFTVAVAAFLLFAALFYAVATVNVVAAILAAAVGFVALSLLLLRGPLRGRSGLRRSLGVLAAEAVCLAICVTVIATGALGFSAWVPATGDVVSVEASYVGTPSYLARPLSGTASDGAYYYHTQYSFDADSDAQAVQAVQAVHQSLISTAAAEFKLDENDFGATVVRYDLQLRYTLKDGSSQVRYFDRGSVAELQALLALDDSERLVALEQAVITGDTAGLTDADRETLGNSNTALAYRNGAVYLADANYNVITALQLGDAPRAELLRALAADVAEQTATERYQQPVQPVATLMFSNSAQIDVSSFGFSFSNAVVPVTPSFANTLAWFEDNGIDVDKGTVPMSTSVNPALIEELAWLPDDPYASVVNSAARVPTSRFFIGYRSSVAGRFWAAPDFGLPATTKDATQIAQLAPKLRTAVFMSGGYLVQAKLRGVDVWVYYYLPADDAPMFVAQTGGM